MENEIKKVSEKDLEKYLKTENLNLTQNEKERFFEIAMLCNLNPFLREIYPLKYEKKDKDGKYSGKFEFNILTGYQVYIERAEQSKLLNGWNCNLSFDNKGEPVGANITIYRKDWQNPFTWSIEGREFEPKSSMAKSMRGFMFKKTCISQGFRLCFPSHFKGMPYTKEEIDFYNETMENPIKETKQIYDKQIEKVIPSIEETKTIEKVIPSTKDFIKEMESLITKTQFDTYIRLISLYLKKEEDRKNTFNSLCSFAKIQNLYYDDEKQAFEIIPTQQQFVNQYIAKGKSVADFNKILKNIKMIYKEKNVRIKLFDSLKIIGEEKNYYFHEVEKKFYLNENEIGNDNDG